MRSDQTRLTPAPSSRSITCRAAATAALRMDRQWRRSSEAPDDVMGDCSTMGSAPPETWPGRYGPCLTAGVQGDRVEPTMVGVRGRMS